jgi:integrase
MLAEGEAAHVVADRLGHAETSTTLRTYAHVLQEMRKGAAHTIGAVLTGC